MESLELLNVETFLNGPGVLLDVRSPAEFTQGHIPGAASLPLFTDQERACVGTTYKLQGWDAAVHLGLKLTGPRLADLVDLAKFHSKDQTAKVYCWRGGMRSASVAWLLQMAGLKTMTLRGGYKSFRRTVLNTIAEPRTLKVVGGLTGCGKTTLLQTLRQKGEQVLDLEELARHRGSSFGNLGFHPQPTNENFENQIAVALMGTNSQKPLWIEDESRLIGHCKIPDPLFRQTQQEPLYFIQKPQDERLRHLIEDYGRFPIDDLIAATERLARKLGGARTKIVIDLLKAGSLYEAAKIVMDYYDTAYNHSLSKRHQSITVAESTSCRTTLASKTK